MTFSLKFGAKVVFLIMRSVLKIGAKDVSHMMKTALKIGAKVDSNIEQARDLALDLSTTPKNSI